MTTFATRNKSRFGKQGIFTCEACGKRTRETGENDNSRYCPVCDTKFLQQNALSDTTRHPDPFNAFENCTTVDEIMNEFDALYAQYKTA